MPRPRLTDIGLPGSGDFYVFDQRLVLFLHYTGTANGAPAALAIPSARSTSACSPQ